MEARILEILRPWVKRARMARDRALHTPRRARAMRRIRKVEDIRSILFICTGNIYRSPYAEKAFLRSLPRNRRDALQLFSAGFKSPGHPSPDRAIRIAKEREISLVDHRSCRIDDPLLERADLVLVIEKQHERQLLRMQAVRPDRIVYLGDLDPQIPPRRAIRDPWGKDEEVFRSSLDRIDRCLHELAALLERAEPDG